MCDTCEQIHMYPSMIFVILTLKRFVRPLSSPAVSALKHKAKQQLEMPDIVQDLFPESEQSITFAHSHTEPFAKNLRISKCVPSSHFPTGKGIL